MVAVRPSTAATAQRVALVVAHGILMRVLADLALLGRVTPGARTQRMMERRQLAAAVPAQSGIWVILSQHRARAVAMAAQVRHLVSPAQASRMVAAVAAAAQQGRLRALAGLAVAVSGVYRPARLA